MAGKRNGTPTGCRRVLIVEDDAERAQVLKRRFRPAAVRVVTNYADAVKALANDRFDIVSLDHDIDDYDRNGQDNAFWMATHMTCPRPARVI